MIRRNGKNLWQNEEPGEDVNPMEGTGNLADAMLVLAVGMMLAVVINWKVDFSTQSKVQELKQAQELTDDQVKQVESNDALKEKGVVYEDPETGKLYIRVQ